jgi:hypothetical protein
MSLSVLKIEPSTSVINSECLVNSIFNDSASTIIKIDNKTSVIKTISSTNIVFVEPNASNIFTIGIQGIAGVNGTDADKHYAHSQSVASNNWIVTHNLNKFPSVSVVDSGKNVVEGEVNYIDSNNVSISFSGAFSGKAYFN